jgi:hypothetical protein
MSNSARPLLARVVTPDWEIPSTVVCYANEQLCREGWTKFISPYADSSAVPFVALNLSQDAKWILTVECDLYTITGEVGTIAVQGFERALMMYPINLLSFGYIENESITLAENGGFSVYRSAFSINGKTSFGHPMPGAATNRNQVFGSGYSVHPF